MKILVTGGAGFIGSHTCVELLNAGEEVIVIDNLRNSKEEAVRRVKKIASNGDRLTFLPIDMLNINAVREAFKTFAPNAVIHFAGLKAVGESVKIPLEYYHNNIHSTLNLCHVMAEFNCKNLVFSSSATVYGNPQKIPITEDQPLSTASPYGRTKLFIEEILRDIYIADKQWNIALLRYFNPVGAHPSGEIGEDPQGIPNNLMPYITQVAIGKLPELSVFGGDYPTPDGTCVRDYIHVVDLAKGHLQALKKLQENPGCQAWNLGTGCGSSVLEVISAFAQASGKKIAYKITDRRGGDVAQCYADPAKARKELNWKAELSLTQMCADSWKWQMQNPAGYP